MQRRPKHDVLTDGGLHQKRPLRDVGAAGGRGGAAGGGRAGEGEGGEEGGLAAANGSAHEKELAGPNLKRHRSEDPPSTSAATILKIASIPRHSCAAGCHCPSHRVHRIHRAGFVHRVQGRGPRLGAAQHRPAEHRNHTLRESVARGKRRQRAPRSLPAAALPAPLARDQGGGGHERRAQIVQIQPPRGSAPGTRCDARLCSPAAHCPHPGGIFSSRRGWRQNTSRRPPAQQSPHRPCPRISGPARVQLPGEAGHRRQQHPNCVEGAG
mmetsp:Transcript_620/g.1861  ORF Transcript_620/g.1861 Transcript_620/m.1861 type:complete len:268 (-) Transcript_620:1447-2250(-)